MLCLLGEQTIGEATTTGDNKLVIKLRITLSVPLYLNRFVVEPLSVREAAAASEC